MLAANQRHNSGELKKSYSLGIELDFEESVSCAKRREEKRERERERERERARERQGKGEREEEGAAVTPPLPLPSLIPSSLPHPLFPPLIPSSLFPFPARQLAVDGCSLMAVWPTKPPNVCRSVYHRLANSPGARHVVRPRDRQLAAIPTGPADDS